MKYSFLYVELPTLRINWRKDPPTITLNNINGHSLLGTNIDDFYRGFFNYSDYFTKEEVREGFLNSKGFIMHSGDRLGIMSSIIPASLLKHLAEDPFILWKFFPPAAKAIKPIDKTIPHKLSMVYMYLSPHLQLLKRL